MFVRGYRWNKPSPAGQSPNGEEDGMVTVETALGLGGVVAVVAALILALSVATTRGEVCQAAREAARSASLGASPSQSQTSSRGSISVDVGTSSTWVEAIATAPAVTIGGWSAPSVACKVKAIREPIYQFQGS